MPAWPCLPKVLSEGRAGRRCHVLKIAGGQGRVGAGRCAQSSCGEAGAIILPRLPPLAWDEFAKRASARDLPNENSAPYYRLSIVVVVAIGSDPRPILLNQLRYS